ncbi:hypothetical protein [Micromonospora sp. RTGN7]|uniref:hypothetical protein n=1 Tax=Micromonospora sp. RTGN7 TaxID=3016526 RepID=UPI0029FEFAFD|nr:hypothetical protein [Micromonospora sp. RTGN7]
MFKFALFLIRVQWIDRLATSSFLIGITIQTALLALALYQTAQTPAEALVLAARAALMTCTAIVLLSAMSSVQNEFRYGTIEKVVLGAVPISTLLLIRSAASAVVSSPAIVVPFLAAYARFPGLVGPRSLLVILMAYVSLMAVCYQSTLVLCQFKAPIGVVAWLRLGLLFIGLSVLPFAGSELVSLVLPTGWILRFVAATGPQAAAVAFAGFLAVTAAWTGLLWKALSGRMMSRIEESLTDGAETR